MEGVQVGCLVKGGVQDVDEVGGKSSSKFKADLFGCVKLLVQEFEKLGVKDCQKFMSLTPPKPTAPKPTPLKLTTPKPTSLKPTPPKPTPLKPTPPKPTPLKLTTPKPTPLKPTPLKLTTPKATPLKMRTTRSKK
jgi:hypothetical protein